MSFYGEIFSSLGLKELSSMLEYNIINYGGRAVYIDGFSGIEKIDALEIVLRLRKGKIFIGGELSIYLLEENSIIIKGKIERISVEEGAR